MNILLLVALPAVPVVILLLRMMKKLPAKQKAKVITGGFLTLNAGILIFALFLMGTPVYAQDEQPQEGASVRQAEQNQSSRNVAIGAGLATGLAAIGAGVAVGITGSAAIGGITQKPEILGRTLIFVGLAEGIAIYGLIVSFMILTGGFGG
jgi:V/A-type H+-transporting ATPase subunit K